MDPTRTDWTDEETETAAAVFAKLRFCRQQNVKLPGNVYEPFLSTKLNVSFEGMPVRFKNGKIQVFLIKRPSLVENPSEAYPEAYHGPGVTLSEGETLAQAFRRLVEDEFGGIEPAACIPVRMVELVLPPRGSYQGHVHLVLFDQKAEPRNLRGAWFDAQDPPKGFLKAHRPILRLAFETFKAIRMMA